MLEASGHIPKMLFYFYSKYNCYNRVNFVFHVLFFPSSPARDATHPTPVVTFLSGSQHNLLVIFEGKNKTEIKGLYKNKDRIHGLSECMCCLKYFKTLRLARLKIIIFASSGKLNLYYMLFRCFDINLTSHCLNFIWFTCLKCRSSVLNSLLRKYCDIARVI